MDWFGPHMHRRADYGVRALVDGAWGFACGLVLTPDGIGEVARRAVARARANRPRRPRQIELAPVVAEQGRWAPPIVEDPFTVPVREQVDVAFAAVTAAQTVPGTIESMVSFEWSDVLDVFASTEGALLVQRIRRADPLSDAIGRSRNDHDLETESVPALEAGWYGYEAVRRIDLPAELREAAERAVARSKPPGPAPASVDVGRYDLVLGAEAVASILGQTLGPALNLERALGYHANDEGTSFAAPPNEILGRYQAGSPLLTLRADRVRPHTFSTVRWDDEGVPAGEYTIIDRGVVVDYLTSRQTAVELAPWYRARGDAVRSRGCMVAGDKGRGQRRPEVALPNLTLEPAKTEVSLDDLIADTKRGLYVPRCSGGTDQQLLSGQFGPANIWNGPPREIRNGKLGRPVADLAFQFMTPQFWKRLDAIGGPASVAGVRSRVVPARVREINVINTGQPR